MTQPLFINKDEKFISRIRGQAGENVLATTSMNQALKWISNPQLAISGIFVNPNDSSQSTLKLLEIALHQRPVTPVFLIDADQQIQGEDQKAFLELAHIRGIYKGTQNFEEFFDFVKPMTPLALEIIKQRTSPRKDHTGFIAVPLIDFINSKNYLFDVFVEDDHGQICLFATAGSAVEPDYLAHVAQKDSWLFVRESSIQEVRETIRTTQEAYMGMTHFPTAWRTAETLFHAKLLLEEARKGGLSDGLVKQTHHYLTDVFHIVSHISESTALQSFVEQARASDRNIACVTLSILMCKTLKFEKNAIVEILGLASFFQDLSLYQSPFGDLSEAKLNELSAEAKKYFEQHPLLSADIVAQHTSLPDVTLQVIRQHHERKDRTGYPHKVGGMQLHPMAEILCLINLYLDQTDQFHIVEHEIYSHFSDRIINAFKHLLPAIERQQRKAA